MSKRSGRNLLASVMGLFACTAMTPGQPTRCLPDGLASPAGQASGDRMGAGAT
jgi:hypothetical protein